jgi:hypothetical protein
MELLFTPTRSLQNDRVDYPFEFTEVKLAIPVKAFLNHRWDWSDFRTFGTGGAMRRIVWITEDTFLGIVDDYRDVLAFRRRIMYAAFTAANDETQFCFLQCVCIQRRLRRR